ncbi:MAG: DUF4173 domain-containing protein [Actinobacteria bacterium]|nr:DUF4173 domain-containing protein [Actinomycetota bacterium]
MTGIVFDVFFYNKTLGISYPVFILLILTITVFIFFKAHDRLENRTWIWAAPILILSITFAIYSNQVLKVLNSIIIPYLVIMMISLVSATNRAEWSDIRFLADFFKRVFTPFRYIHMPFITFSRMQDRGGENKKRIFPRVAIGVLISIPILAIIIWLLSSADIVFKDLFINIPVSNIVRHFFLVLAVTVYTISFFWALVGSYGGKERPGYEKINWKRFLDPVILMTLLGLLNIVFCVFSIIQFKYLFGGESYILPSAFTYAEYARRGFFELVAVAVINFLIILITVSFLKKEGKKADIAIKILLSLLAGFTFVMLASAFYRMLVYEKAYGFTYLRIFVQAFMVLLFFLFIINIVFIWYERLPIIKAYFITTLAVYIALNFANVDIIIASNNIQRYDETGELDMEYLKDLSCDAIPEMEELLEDGKVRDEVLEYFKQKKTELQEQDGWQSLNYSRARASAVIGRYVK